MCALFVYMYMLFVDDDVIPKISIFLGVLPIVSQQSHKSKKDRIRHPF